MTVVQIYIFGIEGLGFSNFSSLDRFRENFQIHFSIFKLTHEEIPRDLDYKSMNILSEILFYWSFY